MMSHPTAHVHSENDLLRLNADSLRNTLATLLAAVKSGQVDEILIKNVETDLEVSKQVEPILIQIGVEGGLVQGVTSNYPLQAVVFDYDTEGAGEDEITEVPQSGESTTEARVIQHNALVDKIFMRDVRHLVENL